MGVDIYYFYHGFEGRHIRMVHNPHVFSLSMKMC